LNIEPSSFLSQQDDYRLPEGMKRIGYDSESGRYYFRDTDGSVWVGPQGAEFGQMTRGKSILTGLASWTMKQSYIILSFSMLTSFSFPPIVNALAPAIEAEAERSERRGSRNDDLEASPRASRNGGYQVLSESDTNEDVSVLAFHFRLLPNPAPIVSLFD
jgi:hypothetical protein